MVAFLSQGTYGIEEKEEPVQKVEEQANIECQLRFHPFDSGEYSTPLKNKFQRLYVTFKNQQHEAFLDCGIVFDIEGAQIIQNN